jgi:hypothetical protein
VDVDVKLDCAFVEELVDLAVVTFCVLEVPVDVRCVDEVIVVEVDEIDRVLLDEYFLEEIDERSVVFEDCVWILLLETDVYLVFWELLDADDNFSELRLCFPLEVFVVLGDWVEDVCESVFRVLLFTGVDSVLPFCIDVVDGIIYELLSRVDMVVVLGDPVDRELCVLLFRGADDSLDEDVWALLFCDAMVVVLGGSVSREL